jgi:hypothetical protein
MPLPTLKRILAIWFVIMLTESIHGTLRTLYLEPLMGSFRARQLSTVTATIIIFTITWLTMRWMRAAGNNSGARFSTATCLNIGAIWVVLTLIFEFSLGTAFGMTWPRMLEDYDLTRGGLMGLGVAAMFVTPWVVNRYRNDKP